MKKVFAITAFILLAVLPVAHASLFPWPVTDIAALEELTASEEISSGPTFTTCSAGTPGSSYTYNIPNRLHKAYCESANVAACETTAASKVQFKTWLSTVSLYFYTEYLRHIFPFNYW